MAAAASRKPKKGEEVAVPRQPWTFDPSTMVYLEAAVDGHRVLADRNCVATCRRLADLIPALIPPPPPPIDPKVAKAAAAASAKNNNKSVAIAAAGVGAGNESNNNHAQDFVSSGGQMQSNRGPSAVSPLFEEDVCGDKPIQVEKVIKSTANVIAGSTPVIPVIKINCLDGRQLEAAMRLAYYKYMGDQTLEGEKRKTISIEQLGLSPDELLAIGTILGC